MAYYGVTGIYTKSPTYYHRDGTADHTPERPILGWHEECAYAAFNVDRTREGWGSWHHGSGISWGPWKAGVSCEVCGEEC